MDNFRLQPFEAEKKNKAAEAEDDGSRKIYEVAQFNCLKRHLGKAVAMKNYWVYLYDILPAS